jgi:general secretion pathway protein K
VINGLGLGGAERLVQVRERTPFKEVSDATSHMPHNVARNLTSQAVSTRSNYFEIRGRLRLNDRVLEEMSLVRRNGRSVVPLSRQRENSREASG